MHNDNQVSFIFKRHICNAVEKIQAAFWANYFEGIEEDLAKDVYQSVFAGLT